MIPPSLLQWYPGLTMPPPVGPPAVPPPDGGWGWAVVGGAFISIGFSYAFPKATTVFFKDIQRIFNASYSEVAWISSIMLAVMYAGGTTFTKGSKISIFLKKLIVLSIKNALKESKRPDIYVTTYLYFK